jgi:exonuclease SbcD
MKILHFADAHIDMANYGRHDPISGLPLRVLDFLKSLDTIVNTAVAEKVDLVVFAGDAYKDRSPAPTYQREWGRRIMRLSRAGIPTLLLVGNHDTAPASGRAHTVQEYETLEVPHIHVLAKPAFLGPKDLEGLPLQVCAIPWVARSGLMANLELSGADPAEVFAQIEDRLTALMHNWLENADPELPTLLTAHASIQGARYGGERTVMLGGDLVLPGSLVRDPRLDYVALGHIHKPQDLNEGSHPPVIYPGSIERVDFGEAGDDKFFIIAHVEKGHTRVEWRQLEGVRPFIDRSIRLQPGTDITGRLLAVLPAPEQIEGAILRLVIEYPRAVETQIDEAALRAYAAKAFEFHLVKRPQVEARVRLPQGDQISSLTPTDLLDIYWRSNRVDAAESQELQNLARQIIESDDSGL